MEKYFDVKRGEIVQSHGKYCEIVSHEHENTLYDTYQEASKALIYGKYKDDHTAFITCKEY